MRVFFSHSSRDHALMRELRGYLPRWISAWIDEEQLLFGEDLELSLRSAIDEQVDYVVLFLGPEALASRWVRREVDWALEREEAIGRVFLLPVLIADVRERMGELGLAGRVTIELAEPNLAGTTMLANRLTNHLGGWMSERLKAVGATSTAIASPVGLESKVDNDIVAALRAVPPAARPGTARTSRRVTGATQDGLDGGRVEQPGRRVAAQRSRGVGGGQRRAVRTGLRHGVVRVRRGEDAGGRGEQRTGHAAVVARRVHPLVVRRGEQADAP
jgi:hypothetical protein